MWSTHSPTQRRLVHHDIVNLHSQRFPPSCLDTNFGPVHVKLCCLPGRRLLGGRSAVARGNGVLGQRSSAQVDGEELIPIKVCETA